MVLVLLLASIVPLVEESTFVDMIEINTVSKEKYGPFGKFERLEPAFTQVILWRWCDGHYQVAQYRIIGRYHKGKEQGELKFKVCKIKDMYHVECLGEYESEPLWRMKTRHFRSTGGTLDPERKDAEKHPDTKRWGYF